MSDGTLDATKVEEIRVKIEKAVKNVFEEYGGDSEGEFEEALKKYVKGEFDIELPRDARDDPQSPENSLP